MHDELRERIRNATLLLRGHLLTEKRDGTHWVGHLSDSALATATAVSAFTLVDDTEDRERIQTSIQWLATDQNPDGGWGDSPDSPSNLSTTLLVRAAFQLINAEQSFSNTVAAAETYIDKHAGTTPGERQAAVINTYNGDRTFAVPILVNCALAGLTPWETIPSLPFELAVVPRGIMHAARLHVVSYALPALISIGRLLHRKHPSRNPFVRLLRRFCFKRTLSTLESLQPESGGFLEAIPLTAFVAMSLAATGDVAHPVAQRGLAFLRNTQRENGSWPIDTDLSVWLTTAATQALTLASTEMPKDTIRWILNNQQTTRHPFTDAAPGGWGWTHRTGGVPDADDTAGALLALSLRKAMAPTNAIRDGLRWLLDLQNTDGGWPTFCRGWSNLPFDRSSPELTAHALQALKAWETFLSTDMVAAAYERGFRFLATTQHADGSWHPLWFGSQRTPDKTNPVYGTARTLRAYHAHGRTECAETKRATDFLLSVQNGDGSWGAAEGIAGTVEETSVTLEALAPLPEANEACERAAKWLCEKTENELPFAAEPIGLYFESLWYSEALYPAIWCLAALNRFGEAVPEAK